MALRKRTVVDDTPVSKPDPKVVAKATAPAETVELVPGVNPGVVVSRSFTVPGNGQFESMKFGVSVADGDYETASARLDTYMLTEAAKAAEQFTAIAKSAGELMDEITSVGDEDVEAGEEEEEVEEAEDFDIDTATREEIVEYISDNDIEIDPEDKKYKGKTGLTKLRADVTEAATAEEDGEEAEEDAEEESEEEAEEEADLSEDDIRAMKRSELTALIKEQGLDIDPADHKKTPALAEAVIEAMSEEDGEEAEEAEEEADEEESEDDAEEGYTRDELEKMKVADLEEIWKQWKIKGSFPTGAIAVKKKAAIKKILEVQEKGV